MRVRRFSDHFFFHFASVSLIKNTLHCGTYKNFAIKRQRCWLLMGCVAGKATTEPVFFTCSTSRLWESPTVPADDGTIDIADSENLAALFCRDKAY